MNAVTLWFNLSRYLVMLKILSSQIKDICMAAKDKTFAAIADYVIG